jgi:hypothetical protein
MNNTLDVPLLQSIATQMMNAARVTAHGKTLRVGRTGIHHLRTVRFTMNEREYHAIEQNPEKPSRWGQLALAGHQVVQFKDVKTNKFVALAVDGDVKVYGRRQATLSMMAGRCVELFIFGRLHARIGCEDALGEAVRAVVPPLAKK